MSRAAGRKKKSKLTSVSAYIAAAPKPSQLMMRQIRAAIRTSVPGAQEKLSYGMPYYFYHGRLAYADDQSHG